MKEKTITIVGVGACGVVCLYQLVEKLVRRADAGQKFRIFLFDKSTTFAMGVAYGTPLDTHLLNLRARYMSAIPDRPHHFVQWLKDNQSQLRNRLNFSDPGAGKDIYAPRWLYGRYLYHLFEQTVAKARDTGIKIEFLPAMVNDIRPDGHQFGLMLDGDRNIKSDYLILTIGNFPSTHYSELKGRKGYFAYPWPAQRLMDRIPPDQKVCVMGAGLSAVDTFFTLMENGHRDRIYFISRTGFLPKVQGPDADYAPYYLTMRNLNAMAEESNGALSLSQAGRLYRKELEEAYAKPLPWLEILNPIGSPASILSEDIKRAQEGPLGYQAVLNAVADLIAPLWNSLAIEDRRMFDREYRTFWNVYQYPMPLINACKILSALQSGQLCVLPGLKRAGFTQRKGAFQLEIKTRFGPRQHLEAAYLINATGQGRNVTRFDDRLIHNLLKRGLLVPHPNGGIQVDYESGAVIHREGRPSKRIFAIGELTRGVHFLTNALGENAKCANRMTDCLIREMAGLA